MDPDRAQRLLAERRARRERQTTVEAFTEEWFPEQRAFYDDSARLIAALCGRRAGKTRGGNKHFLRSAMRQHHGRFLYLNSTLGECRRLAWHGARGDGMASLVESLKLPATLNATELTIHFPAIDSWIYLRGADDEAAVRNALGLPYHEVWWDEAQKIPPKLAPVIRDVLMPTLLDYKGRFRLTGTPVRNMVGLFYSVTRPEVGKRMRGWSVHEWNLLSNPFFGADRDERHQRGMLDLQELLGGPEVAPLDSPTMLREGFGKWIHEDANHVYPVHAVKRDQLCYAPARWGQNGMPDVPTALADLPEWGKRDYFCALGVDLGYSPDPFAWVLWAWSLRDPVLYEVASWKRTELDSDEQVAIMRGIRETVPLAITTADAGGGGKQVVSGWSKKWMERYGLPIIEAKKPPGYKNPAIEQLGSDVRRGNVRVRDGGMWLAEAEQHQWSSVMSATGKLVEDPTTPNHCLDAGLYAHRESYHHRFREEQLTPQPGTAEFLEREEEQLEDDVIDGADGMYRW